MQWLLTQRNKLYEIKVQKGGHTVLSNHEYKAVPTNLETAIAEGCIVSNNLGDLIKVRFNRQLIKDQK